ncbi:hypothetical protein HYV80_06060 [Candidatus Woesearchaeota archaeon]|nr:hypothetical protein [Candidatus Woesearchaeota archaeon]
MAHEHLINWGRHAFERELSLEHIEKYLLKRGLKHKEALKALNEITSFEHKVHEEAVNIRRELLGIPILLLLIVTGIIIIYIFGVMKVK